MAMVDLPFQLQPLMLSAYISSEPKVHTHFVPVRVDQRRFRQAYVSSEILCRLMSLLPHFHPLRFVVTLTYLGYDFAS